MAWDLVDVNMPRLDGFGVVKAMRAVARQAPVLFLTARDSIEDKVTGLDLGASDYLVKPFSFEELMARVRALTRRDAPTPSRRSIRSATRTLDPNSHTVTRNGTLEIKLSAKEFALLEYLLRNQGACFPGKHRKQSLEF